MEWTDETISRLKALWQEGLSTAEIGRQLGITKNAVVGKAHRLGLPARPSPIKRENAKGAEKKAVVSDAAGKSATPSRRIAKTDEAEESPVVEGLKEVVAAADSPLESEKSAVKASPKAVADGGTPTATPVPPVSRTASAPVRSTEVTIAKEAVTVAEPKAPQTPRSAPPRASSSVMEPRRRAPTCCWPIGDPGTPGFHFCGATPIPGKPYCAEHAALAYVKLRDRRESAA